MNGREIRRHEQSQTDVCLRLFVVSITCQTGRVSSSINRDLRLSVSDSSKTTSIVNIRGLATSDNESFAYKVRQTASGARVHSACTQRACVLT